jgi:hypothetical protein
LRRIHALAVLALLSWGFSAAAPVEAQSGTTAVVSGTVGDVFERPIPGALITLTSLDRGGSRETTADGSGRFRFTLVGPGSYEVRAEALGYRPVIARTLTLAGGGRASLALQLVQAPPPVLTVDTVAMGAAGGGRFDAAGLRLGAAELDGLPHRFDEPSSVAALDPTLDASLGAQGLPGSLTLTMVDGLPFYATPHPVAAAEQLVGPAFPRSALSAVSVPRTAPDVEWPGTAGGRVGLTTLTGTAGQGLVLEGGWSGAPLWSSSELDIGKPSLLSFAGNGRTTIPVTPGSSQVVVAAEAMRQETPLTPRFGETVATSLTGLDPDLVTALTEPSVERYSRYSGLLRFDALSETSQIFVRGSAGYATREFDGPGPVALDPAAALPEETLEYSFAGGYLRELSPDMSVELRLGVSGGDRAFDPPNEGMPAALLVGSGSALGVVAGGQGESSRTDLVFSPMLRWGVGGGELKLGLAGRLSKQSMLHELPASYLFSDGAALLAGQGYVEAFSAGDASFTTREIGGFVQFQTELAPGLSATAGVRYDREGIPADGAISNAALLQATGLRSDAYPNGFHQLGGLLGLTWDPAPSTRVYASASVTHGDVDSRALAQLFSRDEDATQTTFAGSGLTWPGGTVPGGASTLPTVTLFGPDARAPRSMQASAGFVRQLAAGWNVHVGGTVRRTDFLMRRRNLNLPVIAQATDPSARDVYGTLQQDGSLVTATGSDARRIDSFGALWALDPDGWSKYWGATAGLEYDGETADLFVSYTRSETTDNWLGGPGLSPLLPDTAWSEGTSDYDVPDRLTATASVHLSPATLSAAYRYRSGLPFTPRYRVGVDANGDGSLGNDVAYVDAAVVDPLLADWSCLDGQVGGFAVRNSCRGPAAHSLDVRLQVRVGRLGGKDASLVLDAFNLVESKDGVIDDALVLVDPAGSITSAGGTVTIPLTVNPDFGSVLYKASRGRMLRVGVRIG